jgi:hypothetical protein
MLKINVTHNSRQVSAAIASAASQVPFALARALTKTAQDVRAGERKEMEAVFDRPTRYTLNALYMRPATKQRLQAEVWLKDSGRNDSFLLPQIEGGARLLKRFEQRLVMTGYMQPSERAVPAAGARLDQYGNMSRGQINQILSQLKTAVILGDYSNATDSRRSRAKRASEAYFVSRGPGSWRGSGSWKNGLKSQHLPRGVWVRRSFGALGTAIKPVLLFVPKALYRKRFRFFEVAQEVTARQLDGHFSESWAIAMRTARFGQQGRLF